MSVRRLSRFVPFAALFCKGVLLVVLVIALLVGLAASPAIFGYRPFSVSETDNTQHPAGALAYYRYVPAETLQAGDAVAVRSQDCTAVRTILETDNAARTLYTAGGDAIPFEASEGVVSFSIPVLGRFAALLTRPVFWILLGIAVLLLFAGAFLLPKWAYTPKYGKK